MTRPPPEQRRKNRRRAENWGRIAESLAIWRLRAAGWRILARDWRRPQGEIDIVARRGRVLAIIEVKARADLASAAYAVLPRQQRRIVRAAAAFVAGRPDLASLDLRFDAVLVAPWRLPRHIDDAWRSTDG